MKSEKLRLSESYRFLNKMANDPAIFPSVAAHGQTEIDISEIWGNCFGLECSEGGFLFHRIDDSMVEAHTLFKAGRTVLSHAREAIHFVFCATPCRELVTRVPITNRAANWLSRKAGMNYRYSIPLGFNGLNGRIDCDYFGICLWEWIIKNEELIKRGEKFHADLLDAVNELTHPEDLIHDAFVGYIHACAEWGNMAKGVNEYNKWAIVSGYQTVKFNDNRVFFENVSVDQLGIIHLENIACQ